MVVVVIMVDVATPTGMLLKGWTTTMAAVAAVAAIWPTRWTPLECDGFLLCASLAHLVVVVHCEFVLINLPPNMCALSLLLVARAVLLCKNGACMIIIIVRVSQLDWTGLD